MRVGNADYHPDVLKRAKQSKLPDIHAAHRLSDKGLRIVLHSLAEVASGNLTISTTSTATTTTTFVKPPTGGTTTTSTGPSPVLKLVKSVKNALWNPAGQTKAQTKKVDAGFDVLENRLATGTPLSPSDLKTLATTATTISNTSLKNLYPGDSTHNQSRGERFDGRTITTGTGAKAQRRLTPTSTELAKTLEEFRKLTQVDEPSVTFGHDPTNVPKTYTNSASHNTTASK
jgi:hypothetical protein